MIAKRILREGPTKSDFARLAHYVVDARGQVNPLTWVRTADYMLDTRNDGAKVGGVRISNCSSDDPASATLEILATQAKNTRSKRDKTYHLVISFPPGERPALSTLNAIEDALVKQIGLADHQRISAIHTDTAHLHIHVAINQVHPTTFRNVEPYYDQFKLMAACERLEGRFGLQRTNHGLNRAEEKANERNERIESNGIDLNDPRVIRALRKSYADAINDRPPAEDLDDLRTLSSGGMDRDLDELEVLLPGDARDDMDSERAKGIDPLRRSGDGAGPVRAGAGRGLSDRPGQMEAHAGRDSLLGWIQREALGAIQEADDWGALHRALGRYGLRYRPRGAGAVLATDDGSFAVKASEVDRGLSLQALTKRWGPFADAVVSSKPELRYEGVPRHHGKDAESLWERYQRERASAIAARANGKAWLQSKNATYSRELAEHYRQRRAQIAVVIAPAQRRTAYLALAAERKRDWEKQRVVWAEQHAVLQRTNPLRTWQEWLRAEAESGNAQALSVLRQRERREADFVRDWLRSRDAAEAHSIVFERMKPRVDRAGVAHYTVEDGGEVRDLRDGVHVVKRTDAAAFLALTLAMERYGGQPLTVEGSDVFRATVARVAGEKGLDVTFSDAGMEAAKASAQVAHSAPNAIDLYIDGRNATREMVPSIAAHRRWKPEDAGDVMYRGRRRLAEGREVLLLEKDGEYLVLPASSNQVAKASGWTLGAEVNVDARGRLMGGGGPKR